MSDKTNLRYNLMQMDIYQTIPKQSTSTQTIHLLFFNVYLLREQQAALHIVRIGANLWNIYVRTQPKKLFQFLIVKHQLPDEIFI